MRLRLVAKLAEVVEGVDLSRFVEGEMIDVSEREANLLIKGGWAESIPYEQRIAATGAYRPSVAADSRRSKRAVRPRQG